MGAWRCASRVVCGLWAWQVPRVEQPHGRSAGAVVRHGARVLRAALVGLVGDPAADQSLLVQLALRRLWERPLRPYAHELRRAADAGSDRLRRADGADDDPAPERGPDGLARADGLRRAVAAPDARADDIAAPDARAGTLARADGLRRAVAAPDDFRADAADVTAADAGAVVRRALRVAPPREVRPCA